MSAFRPSYDSDCHVKKETNIPKLSSVNSRLLIYGLHHYDNRQLCKPATSYYMYLLEKLMIKKLHRSGLYVEVKMYRVIMIVKEIKIYFSTEPV